jgi:CHAT domain-containing protein
MTRFAIKLLFVCSLVAGLFVLYPQITAFTDTTKSGTPEQTDPAPLAEAERLRLEQTKEANVKAVTKFQEAGQTFLLNKQYEPAARAFRNAGEVSQLIGDNQNAISYYNQSLELAKKANSGLEEGQALNDLGYLQFIAGNTNEALKNCSRALEIGQAIGNKSLIAQSTSNVAETYYNVGDFSKAIPLQEQALELWRQLKDQRGEAQSLVALGYYHANLADPKKSLDQFSSALNISRGIKDLHGQALALIAISYLKVKVAEPQEALNALNEARQLVERIGDRTSLASVVGRIGFVYFGLGETDNALAFASEALKLFEQGDQKWGAAEGRLVIGKIHHARGEEELALQDFEAALQLFHSLAIPRLEAQSLQEIGSVYASLHDHKKAIEAFKQSLSLYRPNQDQQRRAYCLNYLGRSYESQNDFVAAQQFYNEALPLSRASSDQAAEILTLHNLAHVARALGNLQNARNWIEASISLAESLRAKVVSQDLRASYFATVRQNYELYIDVLMQFDKNQPGKGFAQAAFAVSEKARARSLLESLQEGQTNIREGVDETLLEKERALSAELNLKADRQIRLIAQQDLAEADKVEKEIASLSKEYAVVQDQIRSLSPHYAALTLPQPLEVSEVQKKLIDDNSILLEYALGDERSYVWLVTRSELSTYQLPSRKQIEESAKRLYSGLVSNQMVAGETIEALNSRRQNANAVIHSETAALSDLLLGPLKGRLGNKRLLIISDGALQYIPFQALNDPDADSQLLFKNHEIINEPSASTLAALINEAQQRKTAANSVAVVADPVFEVDDPRVKRASTASTPESEESKRVKQALRDIGVSTDGVQIPRLYSSGKEADAIVSFAPWGTSLKAVGFDANRARIVGPELSNYRVIHFATHGLINNEHPELSGIVFSLFDPQGRSQDGFLRLHDIYNLHLPADLVVLSACSTGLGKDVRGEGLIGLTRGFMYAGASGVVASLWKVDDEATAELMKLFYEGMFIRGLSPAAALREAQLKMSQQKAWQSPYYWAGFVIQGRYDEKVSGSQLSYLTPKHIGVVTAGFGLLCATGILILRRRRRGII